MAKQGWKLIAGRGKLGDMNWGAEFDNNAEALKPQLEELRKHIGETVLLTGGGSFFGTYWTALLADANIVPFGNDGKVALQAKLSCVNPPLGGKTDFEPYINSWQISVWQ